MCGNITVHAAKKGGSRMCWMHDTGKYALLLHLVCVYVLCGVCVDELLCERERICDIVREKEFVIKRAVHV